MRPSEGISYHIFSHRALLYVFRTRVVSSWRCLRDILKQNVTVRDPYLFMNKIFRVQNMAGDIKGCYNCLNVTEINRLYIYIFKHRNLTPLFLTEQSLHRDALHVRLVTLLQAGSTKLVRCPYVPLLLAPLTTLQCRILHCLIGTASRQRSAYSDSLVFSPSVYHIPRYLKNATTGFPLHPS
jgi:hypothetical protein